MSERVESMKKMFKALGVALFAACLTPAIAWAAGNVSVTLEQNGALKASEAGAVHSALVEVVFSGEGADRITDVVLKDAPENALASTSYSAESKKATIAVSSGSVPLDLKSSSLGTIDIIAQDASEENPVTVDARLVSMQYIDQADSAAATEDGTVNSDAVVRLQGTESQPPTGDGSGDGNGNGNGNDDGNGNGIGNGDGSGSGNGNGNGNGGSNAGSGNTGTADYRPQGVVTPTKTGQSTADNASIVRTGDVMLICGIALGVAAVVVFAAMAFLRRKSSTRE